MPVMHENDITGIVIDAAIAVHKALGPGLLESVYEVVLAHELKKRGLKCERQAPIPVVYDNIRFDEGFCIDILVEDKVIVELKSVEKTIPVHKKQVLTYLRLTNKRVGLLINFGEEYLKDGITRLVNQLPE
ncbi:MAG TPA: GxxExxY protein [Pirellulales bacterium]|nr:GxxExxY protein [Pirellulales bacterium]